jgi:hypothetical protein
VSITQHKGRLKHTENEKAEICWSLWEVTTESKNTASSHKRKITDDKIKKINRKRAKIGSKTGDGHSVTVEQFRLIEGSFKIQEYENLH